MELMERYLKLVDSGRRIDQQEVSISPVKSSLMDLLEEAHREGGLELEGAWRLDAGAGRRLEERTDHVPAGGWRGLASLAAGAGVLSASRESFEPEIELEELADWKPEWATRRLLQAFTRRLVPPTTAAGLFILLGIHPAWGVHIAHRSHRRYGGQEPPGSDPGRHAEMFADETLDVVDDAVFGAVSGIVAALRALEPDQKYPVDTLSSFIDSLCAEVRRLGRQQRPEEGWSGLEPFVDIDADGGSSWRVIDFTTTDLIDAFLIPAGAAHRFNDGTFCVDPDAFDEVFVGDFMAGEQHRVLSIFMTGSPEGHVA